MKRLAFVALMVALAACATDADVSDSAAGAMESDSAHMAQMRADSIRADSIRVDSLRRDSIAKGLIDTTAAGR